jgi:hypothetical protein
MEGHQFLYETSMPTLLPRGKGHQFLLYRDGLFNLAGRIAKDPRLGQRSGSTPETTA